MRANKLTGIIIILTSIIVLYFQYKRFVSYEIQSKVLHDTNNQSWTERDLYFIYQIDDFYPRLNAFAMPMASLKGQYFLAKDSIDLAIKYLEKGAKDNPYIMFSESILSRIYGRQGDFDKFKMYTQKAIKNIPNNPVHFINYARLAKLEKKPDSMVYYFNKIVSKIGPRDQQMWEIILTYLLEDSLNSSKHDAKKIAIEGYKYFRDNPKYKLLHDYTIHGRQNIELASKTHIDAKSLFNQKQYIKSLDLFKKTVNLHPNNQLYVDDLIVAYFNLSMFDEISNLYPSYKEKFTDIQAKMLFYFAQALYVSKNYSDSCKILAGLKTNNLISYNEDFFPVCFGFNFN
jgi:tetratricopeptide (TPR) repeat protein